MRGILFAVSSALMCAAAPCVAQPMPETSKSIQLSKVILDTETTEVKGKLKGGTLCVFPQAIKLSKEKKSENYERYDVLFSEKMKLLGFKTVTTSGDLFAGEDEKNKADFLIGAVIRPDTINLCSSVSGEKGNIALAVDWQIYDRVAQKVVGTITTTGQSTQEKFARDGMFAMWNRAFVASLGALVDQGIIQKYVGNPVPQPAANDAANADSRKS